MCAQCGDKKRSEEIYIKAFTQTHREICVISFKKYIHLISRMFHFSKWPMNSQNYFVNISSLNKLFIQALKFYLLEK